jgi:hypothetical protein
MASLISFLSLPLRLLPPQMTNLLLNEFSWMLRMGGSVRGDNLSFSVDRWDSVH